MVHGVAEMFHLQGQFARQRVVVLDQVYQPVLLVGWGGGRKRLVSTRFAVLRVGARISRRAPQRFQRIHDAGQPFTQRRGVFRQQGLQKRFQCARGAADLG